MNASVIRRPAVAGYFYPSDPIEAVRQIARLIDHTATPAAARAVMVPHGSWTHCGAVIGAVLSRTIIPRRCIIVGPSHTGTWMPWSVMERGWYRTPLGDVPVDARLAEALRGRCPFLEADAWAQRGEHAVEAVLPFLQRLGPQELSITPIITGSDTEEEFFQLGEALAQVVRMAEEPVLLVASSDLSHYEPRMRAVAQDQRVLEAMQALDSAALIRQVRAGGIRMCGYGAVAGVMDAAKRLGAGHLEVVRQSTSADAGGDPDSVIGYAGVRIA